MGGHLSVFAELATTEEVLYIDCLCRIVKKSLS